MKLSARKTCQIIANYSVCQLAHTHTHTLKHTSLHTQQVTDVCSKVFFAQQLKPPHRRKVGAFSRFVVAFFYFSFCWFCGTWKSITWHAKKNEWANCRAKLQFTKRIILLAIFQHAALGRNRLKARAVAFPFRTNRMELHTLTHISHTHVYSCS